MKLTRAGNLFHTTGADRHFMLLTAAVMGFLLLPFLVKHGMFMDGLMYAVISMNLAHGEGTFWFPSFTETIYPAFHDHPPLAFGIQSLFFRLLGDGFLTERIYSLLTAVFTAFFIAKIWHWAFQGQKNTAWIPVLLWITVPVVYWSYANNMLENTLGLFAIVSVWLILTGAVSRSGRFILRSFFAGLFILAGMLSKGLPALFPLAVPVIGYFLFPSFSMKKSLQSMVMVVAGILLPALLIVILWPESVRSISTYLDTQLLASLKGNRIVVNRFHIVESLFWQLLPVIAFSALLLLLSSAGKRREVKDPDMLRLSLFFLAIGLAASLPVMISPKQLTFYLVPSMPYFAMAAGFLLQKLISGCIEKVTFRYQKSIRTISLLAFAAMLIITFSHFGGYSRDREKLADIAKISSTEGMEDIISIDPLLYRDWSLMAYFKRYHGISLDRSGKFRKFHLTLRDTVDAELPDYSEVCPDLRNYKLFRKKIN